MGKVKKSILGAAIGIGAGVAAPFTGGLSLLAAGAVGAAVGATVGAVSDKKGEKAKYGELQQIADEILATAMMFRCIARVIGYSQEDILKINQEFSAEIDNNKALTSISENLKDELRQDLEKENSNLFDEVFYKLEKLLRGIPVDRLFEVDETIHNKFEFSGEVISAASDLAEVETWYAEDDFVGRENEIGEVAVLSMLYNEKHIKLTVLRDILMSLRAGANSYKTSAANMNSTTKDKVCKIIEEYETLSNESFDTMVMAMLLNRKSEIIEVLSITKKLYLLKVQIEQLLGNMNNNVMLPNQSVLKNLFSDEYAELRKIGKPDDSKIRELLFSNATVYCTRYYNEALKI